MHTLGLLTLIVLLMHVTKENLSEIGAPLKCEFSIQDHSEVIITIPPFKLPGEQNATLVCLKKELLSHTAANCSNVEIQGVEEAACGDWMTFCTSQSCCFHLYYEKYILGRSMQILIPFFAFPDAYVESLRQGIYAVHGFLLLENGSTYRFHALSHDYMECTSLGSQLPTSISGEVLNKYRRLSVGNFQGTSTITVSGNLELEQTGNYHFVLYPAPNFPSNFVLIVTFPIQLVCGSSCSKLEETLTVTSEYTFDILNVKNPILPSLFSDISIDVSTKTADYVTIHHQTLIPLSNAGYYSPHGLSNINIEGSSLSTVTSTSYKVNFTNANYIIPSGATILLIFPSQFLFFSATPTLSNLLIINAAATPAFSYPNLTITNGFPVDVPADNVIQFEVQDILNPYMIGATNTFQIFIYINNNQNLISFEESSGLTVTMTTIADFTSFSISPASLKTNELVNYTFQVGIGDGGLNNSHTIKFEVAGSVQECDRNTITEVSGLISIGTTYYQAPQTYGFDVTSNIAAQTTISFQIECVNPYTTASSVPFNISAFDATNEFYEKNANIADMNLLSDFASLTITKADNFPRSVNVFTFLVTSSMSASNVTSIDRILITISTGLEVASSCTPTDITGLDGTLACAASGQIIYITGITKLYKNFGFKLANIRNPELSTTPININILTKKAPASNGENSTTSNEYIPCNFPCKTCSATPTECLSCYPDAHEVFTASGVSLYRYYSVGNECLASCTAANHIYADSITTCADCDAICDQCNNLFNNCTKCFPNTFLHNNQCITPCPSGFEKNVTDWTCFEQGEFLVTSSIEVSPPKEIEKEGIYKFDLFSYPNFYIYSVIELTFPTELSTTTACNTDIGGSSICLVASSSIIRILNAFPDASSNHITFDLEYVNNPSNPCLYSSLQIGIKIKHLDLSITYILGIIPLSNAGYYSPHGLSNINIEGSSLSTVTSTSYKVNFTNANYIIPSGATILLIFPSQFLFFSATPTLSNLLIINAAATPAFSYPNLTITNGFPVDVPADNVIQFEVQDILNPYMIGATNTFQIFIYINNNQNLISFEESSGLTVTMTTIADFTSFSISPASLKTNELVNYTFQVGIGDGGLNNSHTIKFEVAGSVQECDRNTITEVSGLISIGTTYCQAPQTYGFDVTSNIAAQTTISFQIECVNPYTTASSVPFNISAFDATNEFYEKNANIADMNLLSDFASLTVTKADNFPRSVNVFTFLVTSSMSASNVTSIDRILITVSTGLEVASSCTPTDITGLDGTLACAASGQIIYITGITKLYKNFGFKLANIRNPELSTTPININILTKKVPASNGENSTTSNEYIPCNFPCKTCSATPTECLSCYPDAHEVFTASGVSQFMYYADGKECLANCDFGHVYEDSATTCDTCDALCMECDILHTNCTKCYPNTNKYLHNNECIFPCPIGFGIKESDFTCEICYETCSECIDWTSIGCTACKPGYLFLSSQECITNCPPLTFYNNTDYSCQDCDFRCGSCTGGTNSNADCTFCSSKIGVVEMTDGSCDCQFPPYYLKYDSINDIYSCAGCHSDCSNCTGPYMSDCDECADPLMIYNTLTSICECPPIKYKYNGKCLECHEGCNDCKGSTLMDCLSCNEDNGYYPLEGSPTTCLFLCKSVTPLYLDKITITCKPCHSNCLLCFGPHMNQCNSCIPPFHSGNEKECIYQNCDNYLNIFVSNNTCIECHPSCNQCLNLPSNCTLCAPGYLMITDTRACLALCPVNYYSYQPLQLCHPCIEGCRICDAVNSGFPYDLSEENFVCKYCEEDYYLNKINKCVRENECGIGYYPETENRTCTLCDQSCTTCTGPMNYQCGICANKYIPTSTGICEREKCQPHHYLDDSMDCKECHKECKECIDGNKNNCLSCPSGLFPSYVDGSQVRCVPCEDIKGYYTEQKESEKKCKEICGDALNLGEMECDDGNSINGDGCSSKCRIEEGFSCQGGNTTHSDTCKDILNPTLGISPQFMGIHTFAFDLSEPVLVISQEEEKTFVDLHLHGGYFQYKFDYEIYIREIGRVVSGRDMLMSPDPTFYDQIIITFIPLSSIQDNDILDISFQSNIFSDYDHNTLYGITFSIVLGKFKYISPDDKEVVNTSGNTVLYSMLGLLSFNILIAIICSGSMSFLFPLFNMIQLITLIPLLQLDLPENLRSFIGHYLQFANLKFDILFNPFHRWNIIDLTEVLNNPLNDNFEKNDLKSRALIVNYGGQLILWTVVIFLYIPITIIAKCCKIRKFQELKNYYEFAVLLTSFSEAFVEFTLLAFLNSFQMEFHSRATCFCSIIGIIGMLLSSTYIVIVLNIISKLGKNLAEESMIKRFGVLYIDTNYKKHENRMKLHQYYIMTFLARRLFYVLIILFLWRIPITQQVLNITIHSLIFVYDLLCKPCSTNILGILIYFFDLILVIIFGSLPLYMAYPDYSVTLGRIHVYILIATIALSWIIIVCSNIIAIYHKLKAPTIDEQADQIIAQLTATPNYATTEIIPESMPVKAKEKTKKPTMLVQNKRYVKNPKNNINKRSIKIRINSKKKT